MQFRILGTFEVENGSGPVVVRGDKRRGLLALFVANAGEVLSRDRIVEALWNGPTPGAEHTIQTYVSQLRKLLDPDAAIETVGHGYRLDITLDAIDAIRFLETARSATSLESAADRAARLREALALWRGAALEEFLGTEWADPVARELEQRRLEALEQRIEADLALGRAREVLGELDTLVRTYPMAEPLCALRMFALYRCGRQADALRAYAELRTTLTEELGIEPSRALADLELRILDQDDALLTPTPAGHGPADTQRSDRPTLPSGTVTFLLTDIVSSTALWEARPAEMAVAVRQHEAVIAEIVEASGGHLLKRRGEGDSTMSVFDRAADAIEAAVAVLDRIERPVEPLALPLALRVALHTGEVEQRDLDYFGRTLNRAARLRSVAAANEVLCSRATAELVADALPASIGLVELGEQRLRGLRRHEVVYRVVRSSGDEGRAPPAVLPPHELDEVSRAARLLAVATHGPELVGRDAEHLALVDMWQRARSGEGLIAFLGGEPGIGKTRLAAEVALAAAREGATVLYGRCDEGLGVPYQPFVEALRSYVEDCPNEELRNALGRYPAELVRLLPEIADRVPDLGAPLRSDPATEQYRLFDAVRSCLGAVARRTPLVLVLDDLHCAAEPTLLLLRHVAASEQLERALLVVTYRPSELPRPSTLLQLLADLRRSPKPECVRRVDLVGLDEAGVRAFVEHANAGVPTADLDSFAHALHVHTGGNPFFVHEIVRNLVESGTSTENSPAADDSRLPGLQIPDAVRGVILNRVGRLSAPARQALTVAAVAGYEFDGSIVAAVTGLDDDALLDALEEATAAGLIDELSPDRFVFAHALVQTALYDELTVSRQVRLHRRVGEAIERRAPAPTGTELSQIAYHFARTDPEKAVRYAIAAADAALDSLAFQDAVTVCERALAAVASAHDTRTAITATDECDLLLRLGRALSRAGDKRGRATLLRAAACARRLGDPARQADAVLGTSRGFFARVGRVDRELVAALEEAIGAQPPGDSAALAVLRATLASELVWAEDGERRFSLSDEALAMARRLSDAPTLVRVLLLRSMTILVPETLDERWQQSGEFLQVAQDLGDPALLFDAAFVRGGTAWEAGDAEEANRMEELATALAHDLREPRLIWQAGSMRVGRLISEGALAEAEALAATSLELGRQANQGGEALVFFTENMFEIRRWQGRLGEMLDVLRQFAGSPTVDFGHSVTRYLYDAGERDRALSIYEQLKRVAVLPPRRDMLALPTLQSLAYLAARGGDAAYAAELYRALLPHHAAFAHTTVAKAVGAHFLGMLAVVLGEVTAADAHFAEAMDAHSCCEAPLLLAETRLEAARAAAASGAWSSRGRGLLEQIRVSGAAHGAGFLLEQCDELERRMQTSTTT